jgi:hypothetical protein
MPIYESGLESFEAASEQEIVARKLDFLSDGGDFLYLRKGEDVGAVEVAIDALNLLQQAATLPPDFAPWVPDVVTVATGIVGGALTVASVTAALNKAWKFGLDQLDLFRENLRRTKCLFPKKTSTGQLISWEDAVRNSTFPVPKDLRIICNRDSENEKAIALFRLYGARIRHRPKSVATGSHRFYLNDKRTALFFRQPDRTFLGITGHDLFLESKLKSAFLQEWEHCGPDVDE